jgi:hypothetical protein
LKTETGKLYYWGDLSQEISVKEIKNQMGIKFNSCKIGGEIFVGITGLLRGKIKENSNFSSTRKWGNLFISPRKFMEAGYFANRKVD